MHSIQEKNSSQDFFPSYIFPSGPRRLVCKTNHSKTGNEFFSRMRILGPFPMKSNERR
jgi:hypothetical protein